MSIYSKLDYREALFNASKSMIRVRDPITLLKLITRFIDRQVGVTHVGILLRDSKRGGYILIDSKGEAGKKIPVGYIRIPEENAIVRYFLQEKDTRHKDSYAISHPGKALIYEQLEHIQNFEIFVSKNGYRAITMEEIKKQMEMLRGAICMPSFFKKELLAILILGHRLSGEPYLPEEVNLFATLANDVAMAIKNADLIKNLTDAFDKQHRLFLQTAIALVAAIDARDHYTHGHSERVSHYSVVIARGYAEQARMENQKEFLEWVQLSALLHDVGKIGIRDEILNKPSTLTPEEWAIMRRHVEIGVDVLKPIEGIQHIQDGVLYHHEHFDGKGYPAKLSGENIPIIGRIVSIADAYDTMTTTRPYQKKKIPEEAFVELKRCAGTQFDPILVGLFYKAYRRGSITKKDYLSVES